MRSPIGADRFRAIAGAFPTGVAIVTTIDAAGEPKGLTTQSFVSVSTEPPLVLICVDKTSRTLPALLASRTFVLNFLAAGREELANLFASKRDDKFAAASWRASEAAHGAPILEDDVVAYAECLVREPIEAGDHWLLLASVVGGAVADRAPLMYYRRRYAAWPS